MFQTTRRRLAIWYTAVTAILLLLFASGFYFYARTTLIERIDDTLLHVVEVIERSLVIDTSENNIQINIEASFRDNTKTLDDDRIEIEWFNPSGELLWSTLPTPLNIPIRSNRTGETIRIDNQPKIFLRQISDRVEIDRQILGYLRVSHPWFEVTKPIRQLVLDLTVGISLMVISAAAIGWLLSGLAMEPVRESYQRLKKFTADASHELRNPIATIQTNVQVALADPELESSQHRQQLQVIERLTRRLGRLVDDLLFLARHDSGMVESPKVAVPLDALLMEVVEEQRAIATAQGIAIELKFSPIPVSGHFSLGTNSETRTVRQKTTDSDRDAENLESDLSQNCPPNQRDSEAIAPNLEEENMTLQGDWDRLARLFANLISNAVQYSSRGDRIFVELQRVGKGKTHIKQRLGSRRQKLQSTGNQKSSPFAEASGDIQPEGRAWILKGSQNLKSDCLVVTIKDNGIGIPAEALPHLCDRFYRADPARAHAKSVPPMLPGGSVFPRTAPVPELVGSEKRPEKENRGSAVGSGLGLAIALAIVENHRGQIAIESQPQVGTTVTVVLPVQKTVE